mmetsp:Transcript_9525/g.25870  ORF Transcript_9525/g.25870 Transcript_9525/m.25870 type:complete len:243 (-) Transcript_9525:173-901(-)
MDRKSTAASSAAGLVAQLCSCVRLSQAALEAVPTSKRSTNSTSRQMSAVEDVAPMAARTPRALKLASVRAAAMAATAPSKPPFARKYCSTSPTGIVSTPSTSTSRASKRMVPKYLLSSPTACRRSESVRPKALDSVTSEPPNTTTRSLRPPSKSARAAVRSSETRRGDAKTVRTSFARRWSGVLPRDLKMSNVVLPRGPRKNSTTKWSRSQSKRFIHAGSRVSLLLPFWLLWSRSHVHSWKG